MVGKPVGVRVPPSAPSQDSKGFLTQGHQQPGILCLLRLPDITSDHERRAECFLILGPEYEKLDEYEGAIGLYQRGIECKPKEVRTRYFLHNNLGYCFNQLGLRDDAERMCRAAIVIDSCFAIRIPQPARVKQNRPMETSSPRHCSFWVRMKATIGISFVIAQLARRPSPSAIRETTKVFRLTPSFSALAASLA